MEFADLDDDLFSEKRQRSNIDEGYLARFCHHCWFLDASPDLLVSEEDKLSVQKHSADYFYFKKDYEAAIAKYEDVLCVIPAGNTTVKRECYEGIVRSYIKIGTPDKAVELARKLHATSKTLEQMTVSCSVLIDTCIAARKYVEALEASQLMISLHPFNCNVWLKLACVYAHMYDIEVTIERELLSASCPDKIIAVNGIDCNVDSATVKHDSKDSVQNTPLISKNKQKKTLSLNFGECAAVNTEEDFPGENDVTSKVIHVDEEKGLQYVCACLYRSFMMLKRTEGTSSGFALDYSLLLQKKIISDMNALLDEKSLQFIKHQVSRSDNVYSGTSPSKESTPEFVDRGSSKFKEDISETSVVTAVSRSSFERQWFKWMK